MKMVKCDLSNINTVRLELLNKSYLTQKDIQKFVPCGQHTAKKIYEDIRSKITDEGLENHSKVILTKRLVKYLKLSEESIIKAAEREKSH